MDHRVRFAPDDLMPRGRNWVLHRDKTVTTLYLRRSIGCTDAMQTALEEAWEGFCEITEVDSPQLPEQRQMTYLYA